jgi:Mg2+/Co2+ transporter CorC
LQAFDQAERDRSSLGDITSRSLALEQRSLEAEAALSRLEAKAKQETNQLIRDRTRLAGMNQESREMIEVLESKSQRLHDELNIRRSMIDSMKTELQHQLETFVPSAEVSLDSFC